MWWRVRAVTQHPGGHRVQGARVADPPGGEDAAAPPHHVMAGRYGLVDNHDSGAGCSGTIAALPAALNRPSVPARVVSGGPDGPSMRIQVTRQPVLSVFRA